MPHYDSITVLICTWNRSALLRETLRSLSRMQVPPGLSWEVLVVDNNSTDETRSVVAECAHEFPTRLAYAFEAQPGKSSAMNAGLRNCAHPVIAFADDDVVVDPQWLSAVGAAFRARADISYVGGPVAPLWESPCPQWFPATGTLLWGTLAILDYGSDPFVFEERQRIPLGANFAVRRSLVDRIGGFDPNLGRNGQSVLLGQELPEFFARARRVGAIGMYVPAMRVQHRVPAHRLRPQYFRRWWYGKGISRARLEAVHPVTELGLDLRHVPTIAGIPRFLFGSAMRDARRWWRAVLSRDAAERFAAETQLWYFGGQIRERLRRSLKHSAC